MHLMMIASSAPADGTNAPIPADAGWSDDEIESLLGSAILLAIVSGLVYFLVLRPILAPKDGGAAAGGAGGTAAGQQQQRQRGGAGQPGAAGNVGAGTARRRQGGAPTAAGAVAGGTNPGGGSPVPAVLSRGTRRPPHLSATSPGGPGGSTCLLEGIVPFRRTEAGGYEAQLAAEADRGRSSNGDGDGPTTTTTTGDAKENKKEDLVTSNRRARARLFARLLSPTVTGAVSNAPPARGSNVVVCVPSTDTTCPQLHRILWLLGTYYNLFVVLCLPPLPVADIGSSDEFSKENELMDKLRDEIRAPSSSSNKDGDGAGVPREVLPDHRIVATRSVEGRVAFVRQMHRPEFVLDFEEEIKNQLVRFGFTVLLYGQGEDDQAKKQSGKEAVSSLGRTLLA